MIPKLINKFSDLATVNSNHFRSLFLCDHNRNFYMRSEILNMVSFNDISYTNKFSERFYTNFCFKNYCNNDNYPFHLGVQK